MVSVDFNNIISRAISLHKKGGYTAAQNWYRSALNLQPRNSNLLRLYGMSFYQQGNLDEAMNLYYRAIAAQPDNAEVWRHLGMALKDKGKFQEALDAYQRAITYRRNNPEAFRNLGNVLVELNRNDEALVAYQEALRLKPDYADAYTNLGSVLEKQGNMDDAIAAHQKAIDILPTWPPAYNNLGHALLKKGQFRSAIQILHKALKFKPDYAIAWSNLGIAFSALGKMRKAEEALKKACILDVRNIPCKRNLAIFFQQIGLYDEALRIYEELCQLQPGKTDPYFNIADVYHAKGEYKSALDVLKEGIAVAPDDSNAHLALSLNLLKHGHYEDGFSEYEWRRKNNYKNRQYDQPEWQGEDLSGKTILLHPEQGLGDMIQFVRFADLLHRMGAKVLLEMYPSLQKIFSYSLPHLSIISPDMTISQEFDCYSPLMSVPAKLQLSLNDISGDAYLIPVPEKMKQWQSFLNKDTLNIGIVWQGNPKGAIDRGRSIPLHFFKSLSDIDNVQLYSLQKNFGLDQLDDISGKINIRQMPEDFDAGADAFLDTLALMQNLDLVVTSDTSVAHIGGACGCPTWIALKHNPDWRWGMTGEKSMWYHSVRLFRQMKSGEWSTVFHAIADAFGKKL